MENRHILSNIDISKLEKFSKDVVSKGQNKQNYWSSDPRTKERQEMDTFRGKAVEVILCRMLDEKNIPHSDIDWEVGKGIFGSTKDSGFDIIINRCKVSINATGPYDKLLLIPKYKFIQHKKYGVYSLALGTVPKEKVTYVDIDGFISLYDFELKMKLFERNGKLGLSTDNYGILKTELRTDWDFFRGISLQELLLMSKSG
jgi:hypothetical protein